MEGYVEFDRSTSIVLFRFGKEIGKCIGDLEENGDEEYGEWRAEERCKWGGLMKTEQGEVCPQEMPFVSLARVLAYDMVCPPLELSSAQF
jgi:hypothetical protein